MKFTVCDFLLVDSIDRNKFVCVDASVWGGKEFASLFPQTSFESTYFVLQLQGKTPVDEQQITYGG
jgi:hypothetical protein